MFNLPEGVSFEKKPFKNTYAYYFKHESLGALGRILIEPYKNNKSIIKSELAPSDPSDPRKSLREDVFGEVSDTVNTAMTSILGDGGRLPQGFEHKVEAEKREYIQNKLCQCEACDKPIHFLIFAPEAKTYSDFIDVKRKMFGPLNQFNLPSFVLGIPDDEGTAFIYQVWPNEKELGWVDPDTFNDMLGNLCKNCKLLI